MARILVVDDEVVIGTLLKDVLSTEGHEVLYEQSSLDGLHVAEKRDEEIDLYILDLKMPELSGVELLTKIKLINPNAVVVVVTGHPTFESIQSVLRLGGYDYITKPFNINDICFSVNRAISYHDLILLNLKLKKDMERQNALLDEKINERTQELLLLTEIAKEISTHLSLEDVLETIVTKVTTALNSEICSILLYNKETDTLRVKMSNGLDSKKIESTIIKSGQDISGWVFKNRKPVLVEDIENDERFQKRNGEKYYNGSFMSIPLLVEEEIIGVINLSNKKSREVFSEDDFRFFHGIAIEASIAIENANLYTTLEGTALNTIYAVNTAIDLKDSYSKEHTEFVTKYGMAIAEEMGLPKEKIETIYKACLLHDIGKIAIHDYILTKKGDLSKSEWEEMKTHPSKGSDILRPLKFLGEVITFVEQHHERFDGEGYPKGLKGTEISLGARILSVADTYAALTAQRPYRKALSSEQALEEIVKNRGTQFDPDIVDCFEKAIKSNKIS